MPASNSDVMLLTADLGYSVLEQFADELPDQYCNVGVCEQAMVGIAAGLALSGKRVVLYSIANFPTLRCLEQLRNDVCYHDLPVTVISVGGGLAYGAQGYTHHGLEDLGIMASIAEHGGHLPRRSARSRGTVAPAAGPPRPCLPAAWPRGRAGDPRWRHAGYARQGRHAAQGQRCCPARHRADPGPRAGRSGRTCRRRHFRQRRLFPGNQPAG